MIDLQELRNKDFNYYSNNRNYLFCENEHILRPYYESLCSIYKIHEHLNIVKNSATRNKSFRYLFFTYNDRVWLVLYKVITILKTRQIRFYNIPVPKTFFYKWEEDAIQIISELKKSFFIKFVFSEHFYNLFNDISPKHEIKRLEILDEFFYDISNDNKNFNSKKFLSKREILKMERSHDVKITCSTKCNINETFELYEKWSMGMEKKKDNVRKSSRLKFVNFVNETNKLYTESIFVISVIYKNSAIMQIFLVENGNDSLDCAFYIHIWESLGDVFLNRLTHNFNDIEKYLTWKFFRNESKKIFYGVAENKKLRKHKEMICDGFIKYYII